MNCKSCGMFAGKMIDTCVSCGDQVCPMCKAKGLPHYSPPLCKKCLASANVQAAESQPQDLPKDKPRNLHYTFGGLM